MLRGEKRATPADGAGASASTGPVQKKHREKMPDFDWSADNYALTWRLVDQLRNPENRSVLFPDQEGTAVKTGDTKEDVYRRIAKVVHPEAFAQDPQTAGSRMKNKNVAMWKEYSGYCRRLQDLCTTHQILIPVSGPDESCPPDIHSEWRKIAISMPVFPALRTFMPVRPEEKYKAPTSKTSAPRGVSSSYTHTIIEEDKAVDHHRESHSSSSFTGPVSLPPVHRASVARDTAVAVVEGHHINNVQEPQIPFQTIIALHDYLELRRSYQEDVRLGIFTPAEAKLRIEALDKRKAVLESNRLNGVAQAPQTSPSTASTPTGSSQFAPLQASTPVIAPDHMIERVYEEKALLLGFRRKLSRLGFIQATHPHELGMPVQIMIATRSGLVPLAHHAPAACARFESRSTVPIMDLPLVIHSSSGWETTIWDHAHAIIAAALRRPLSIEDVKAVQANVHAIRASHGFRQQFQLLNENSTFFDILRTGLLCGNSWTLGGAAMVLVDDTMEQV
ncbi:hypothetical protein EW145_g5612 [Phellinidium pouzarii]|uniref:Uncharacterized protein n=1 Tax=Phellinidium pouzarii TaxID=167371 RepID=A0A4S4KZZ5_9AGAM|nr:hypothetical protein EW145_g5612 [Phellinidium pouzarii]